MAKTPTAGPARFNRRFLVKGRNLPNQSLAAVGANAGPVAATLQAVAGYGRALIEEDIAEKTQKAKDQATRDGKAAGLSSAEAFNPIEYRERLTEADDAYNTAIRASYLSRVDLSIDEEITQHALAYPDNPAAFTDAFDKSADKFMGLVDADVRPDLALNIQSRKQRALLPIMKNARTKSEAQANAVLLADGDAYRDQALNAWRTDNPDEIEASTAKYEAVLSSRSDLSPQQKTGLLLDFEQDVRRQVVLGGFDQAKAQGFDQARAYVEEVANNSKGIADPDERDLLTGEMAQDLRALDAQRKAQTRQLRGDLKSMITVLGKGYPVGDQLTKAKQAIGAVGDPDLAEELRVAERLFHVQQSARQQTPAGLERAIAEMDERLGTQSSVSEEQLNQRDIAGKIKTEMDKALGVSVLEWAGRSNVVTVSALDFQNPQSVAARVEAARVASVYYGRDALPFLPEEITMISKRYQEADALGKTAVLSDLAELDMPDDMQAAVLDELNTKDPHMAFMVDLSQSAPLTARSVMLGKSILADNKGILPKPEDVEGAYFEYMGDALRADQTGTSRAAIQDAAAALYAQKIQGDGFQEDIEKYSDAVAEVVGTVIEHNDQKTILPRGLPEEMFHNWVDGLTEDNLFDMRGGVMVGPHRQTPDGLVPMGAKEIREDGRFVTVGDGQYMIAVESSTGIFGDDELRYAVGEDGQPFVLDINTPEEDDALTAAVGDQDLQGGAGDDQLEPAVEVSNLKLLGAARKIGRHIKGKLFGRQETRAARRELSGKVNPVPMHMTLRTVSRVLHQVNEARRAEGHEPLVSVTLSPADYPAGYSQPDIVQGLAEAVYQGHFKGPDGGRTEINFGPLDPYLVDRIKGETGIDLADYQDVIDTDGISHAKNSHGPDAKQSKDQEPVGPEAFATYRHVLNGYDRLSTRTGTDGRTLKFEKDVNGVMVVVEKTMDKRRALAFKTMWIKKRK